MRCFLRVGSLDREGVRVLIGIVGEVRRVSTANRHYRRTRQI